MCDLQVCGFWQMRNLQYSSFTVTQSSVTPMDRFHFNNLKESTWEVRATVLPCSQPQIKHQQPCNMKHISLPFNTFPFNTFLFNTFHTIPTEFTCFDPVVKEQEGIESDEVGGKEGVMWCIRQCWAQLPARPLTGRGFSCLSQLRFPVPKARGFDTWLQRPFLWAPGFLVLVAFGEFKNFF